MLVIDEDRGISGTSVENRPGFQRLLAEIALGHVGIVFGREMSRLARSCADWHRLLERSALFQVLLGDADGVYDPVDFDDRLLLGLKGTMSEAELHILRARRHQGKLNKARRGELFTCVPVGYVRSPEGKGSCRLGSIWVESLGRNCDAALDLLTTALRDCTDDLWEPTKLERVAPLCMSEPRPAIVFSDFRTFGTENSVHRPSESLRKWDASLDVLVPFVSVIPSAALVPAGLPNRFVTWARNDEDAIFFNELAETGPVRCVPEPLMHYRKHPASAQAKAAARPIGAENLLRWARDREATSPGTVARLFHTLAGLVVTARWKRDWPRYWMFRDFCERNWPEGVERHPVLSERVWPRVFYRLKDAVERR